MKRAPFRFALLVCSIVLVGIVSQSFADISGPVQPPTLTLKLLSEPSNGTFEVQPSLDNFECNGGTTYCSKNVLEYPGILGGNVDLAVTILEFDPDPYVLNNVIITNTSGSQQTLSYNVTQPAALGAPNLISGSITTQVIDGGQDGAIVAAQTGGSIYSALIDGVVVHTLQDDPFSVVAPAGGVNNALASFGPDANGTAVIQDIGITLIFELSPGDTASILSRFDVVPEPATLSLLALGGLILLWRRR